MAKRTIHMLVDDLDGGDAEESISFACDGVNYEIDLSKKNAAKLRDALAPFCAAGSRIGRGGVASSTNGRRPARPAPQREPARTNRDQNRAIREWAQSKGMDVSDRGRIAQPIVDRYHAEAGRGQVRELASAVSSSTVTGGTAPAASKGRRKI